MPVSFMSDGGAERVSKSGVCFGTAMIEGVLAPETATARSAGTSAFRPMLALELA